MVTTAFFMALTQYATYATPRSRWDVADELQPEFEAYTTDLRARYRHESSDDDRPRRAPASRSTAVTETPPLPAFPLNANDLLHDHTIPEASLASLPRVGSVEEGLEDIRTFVETLRHVRSAPAIFGSSCHDQREGGSEGLEIQSDARTAVCGWSPGSEASTGAYQDGRAKSEPAAAHAVQHAGRSLSAPPSRRAMPHVRDEDGWSTEPVPSRKGTPSAD